MNNLNIDEIVEYVKNIADNLRCVLCDKLDGNRMRYSCGHTACSECVIATDDCQICLTQSQQCCVQPILDNELTLRVKNTSALLQACQDLFKIDVFKRKRLSEQLRIEKELFPKCIQAPQKYGNKRRSTTFSYNNKENRRLTLFPGEETSHFKDSIMEPSDSYVQQWLNKNGKDFSRKPFRDLSVNTELHKYNRLHKEINSIKGVNNENVPLQKRTRKRSHFKTTLKNGSYLGGNIKSDDNSKRTKKELNQSYHNNLRSQTNDESGIFMDNDPITIDDSQESIIDKDKNAWLAVLKASKNEDNESTSIANLDSSNVKILNCNDNQTLTKSYKLKSKDNEIMKVPFYKKSYITETCKYCNTASRVAGQPKEVEITIDNDSFTTTIKVINNVKVNPKLNATNSVFVQTDILGEKIQTNHNITIKDSDVKNEKDCSKSITQKKTMSIGDVQSGDLFGEEGRTGNEYKNNEKCIVIEESESDVEMEASGPFPVKVDVHRSCEELEYGILGEIVNIQKHDIRPRRGPRGLTPTSTDSSEKENFNPNRMKKHSSRKKKYVKK